MRKLFNPCSLTNQWPAQPMIHIENQPMIHIDNQHMVQHNFGPHNVILPNDSIHTDKLVQRTSRLFYVVIHFVSTLLDQNDFFTQISKYECFLVFLDSLYIWLFYCKGFIEFIPRSIQYFNKKLRNLFQPALGTSRSIQSNSKKHRWAAWWKSWPDNRWISAWFSLRWWDAYIDTGVTSLKWWRQSICCWSGRRISTRHREQHHSTQCYTLDIMQV